MKSFNMMVSVAKSGAWLARYYIDGKVVKRAEYDKLDRYSARQDSFCVTSTRTRWQHRKVVYL